MKFCALAISLILGAFSQVEASFAAGEATKLDPASQEALQKTQTMLTNPAIRSATLKEDQNAKSHDGSMRQTFGTEKTEEIYKISSEVMDKLVKETGGDVMKMMEILAKAQRDPASMHPYFSPAQQQKIQEMAKQIDGPRQP